MSIVRPPGQALQEAALPAKLPMQAAIPWSPSWWPVRNLSHGPAHVAPPDGPWDGILRASPWNPYCWPGRSAKPAKPAEHPYCPVELPMQANEAVVLGTDQSPSTIEPLEALPEAPMQAVRRASPCSSSWWPVRCRRTGRPMEPLLLAREMSVPRASPWSSSYLPGRGWSYGPTHGATTDGPGELRPMDHPIELLLLAWERWSLVEFSHAEYEPARHGGIGLTMITWLHSITWLHFSWTLWIFKDDWVKPCGYVKLCHSVGPYVLVVLAAPVIA